MNIEHKMPPRTLSGEKTTYEQIFERGYKQGFEEGYKQGREEGYKQGYEEGYKQGREIAIRAYMLNHPTVSDQDIADSFEISLDYARKIRDHVDQFLGKKI